MTPHTPPGVAKQQFDGVLRLSMSRLPLNYLRRAAHQLLAFPNFARSVATPPCSRTLISCTLAEGARAPQDLQLHVQLEEAETCGRDVADDRGDHRLAILSSGQAVSPRCPGRGAAGPRDRLRMRRG
jgi:hypothetical protein